MSSPPQFLPLLLVNPGAAGEDAFKEAFEPRASFLSDANK